MFDAIAARSVTPVKIAIIAGKSFLYFHGLTRAAALTYTTFLAVVPLLILLTSITIAVGFGSFVSDYLPHLLNILNLDWPIDPIIAIVKNAEHVPIGKLGFIGAMGLFVTFILAFGSLESNFNVVWENKVSRPLHKQLRIYTPLLLIFAGIIGLYAGFVNHVQNALSVIVIDGLHFDPSVLHTLIDAFWYVTFHGAIILIIFLTLYALPARPDPKTYTKKKLLLSSIGISFLAWFSIMVYVRILMLIQTTLVTRMSIFYGSLAFIPLILFLVFGIWTIVLCGNSIVWTICTWPESKDRIWNWEGSPSEDLNMTKDRM
ncbi:YihY/virulence factor BrkB family protein [uncultured Fibrobacter sp.]|uniref:YihY/virulence factor BrkB family protein n=1 Tax=uncultured Fibrobacter sp. TaxID=261512 RepID=UPI002622F65E|nr:YhjD/YihY/BrkB family envelope integrity protein [uncultured Fibrobacter sp.]